MQRTLISSLPQPIAEGLQHFLDEDLPRSADELSELLVGLIEYLGGVGISDYLDGAENPKQCARNANLNGWLISQLTSGKTGTGIWARWTQMAVQSTIAPKIPCLKKYVAENDLDDPNSNLSWMLRFRNDVMHGGFVAPLPRIIEARRRLEEIFAVLAPLWELRPAGCLGAPPDPVWRELTGLQGQPMDPPTIARESWIGVGAVLLVDAHNTAQLAIHPACTIDLDGHLHIQHNWKQHHLGWFHRSAQIRGFFERYQRERSGTIEASDWFQEIEDALPEHGILSRTALEERVLSLLSRDGVVISFTGPVGSGRSTFAYQMAKKSGRKSLLYPTKPSSVRMDPSVLQRWVETSCAQMGDEKGLLIIDDAHLIGRGLYASVPSQGILKNAQEKGISVIFIHPPSQKPPMAYDYQIAIAPWSEEELAVWGDPAVLRLQTGGHPELLVGIAGGLQKMKARMLQKMNGDTLSLQCLTQLQNNPMTVLELSRCLKEFAPRIELRLREMLDWIIEKEISHNGKTEREYALHPGFAIAIRDIAP
ncbi:MAG: hypothetical protein VX278_11345 [Myxococcota bacterium]|nr:hypothetical protein [Myxococcota bacterium]